MAKFNFDIFKRQRRSLPITAYTPPVQEIKNIVSPVEEVNIEKNWTREFRNYWGLDVQDVNVEDRITPVNIFSPYYTCNSTIRQAELDACVKWNSNIPGVKLFLIVDISCSVIPDEKVTIIRRSNNGRVKYQEILDIIRTKTSNTDLNCIINSDIILDKNFTETIRVGHKDFICLTRHEIDMSRVNISNVLSMNFKDTVVSVPENPGSQDLWLFTGHADDIILDFYMGIPGCDNMISLEFYKKGYRLFNPSKTFCIYHVHSEQNESTSYPFTYFNLPEFKLCHVQIR
jgi:hypothetical protein